MLRWDGRREGARERYHVPGSTNADLSSAFAKAVELPTTMLDTTSLRCRITNACGATSVEMKEQCAKVFLDVSVPPVVARRHRCASLKACEVVPARMESLEKTIQRCGLCCALEPLMRSCKREAFNRARKQSLRSRLGRPASECCFACGFCFCIMTTHGSSRLTSSGRLPSQHRGSRAAAGSRRLWFCGQVPVSLSVDSTYRLLHGVGPRKPRGVLSGDVAAWCCLTTVAKHAIPI